MNNADVFGHRVIFSGQEGHRPLPTPPKSKGAGTPMTVSLETTREAIVSGHPQDAKREVRN